MTILNLDQISNGFDNTNYSIGIFIKLSQAFDTPDHTILLQKHNHYWVRGNTNDFFSNYIVYREQYLDFRFACSEPCDITFCVLQGLILGPFYFCFLCILIM